MAKTRVYLVADEAINVATLREQLTHLGYAACGQAMSGEEALQEVAAARPELVLMDIQLAGRLTGIETATRLRQRHDLPVVYLCATSDAKLVEEAGEDGSFGYLVKPFEERELHATILAALYKHRFEKLLRGDASRQAVLLRRAGEIARLGGWELALPSRALTWSDEVYRICEVDRINRTTVAEVTARFAPESRSIIEAAIRETIETGAPFDLELAFSTAKGRRLWVRAQGKAEWENGKIVRLVGSLQDVTDRKEATESLRRSEARFRTLYNATSDAVMVLDAERFLDCNPATLAIFGSATREEFCSKHPADLSPPRQPCGTDSLALANQRIVTALRQGSHCFEWLHCRADTGQPFPAEVWLTAMELDGRKVLQAVVRDLTERKHVETIERRRGEQLLRFQSTLLALRDHEAGDLSGFFRFATEEIARAMEVERVGIWFFDDARGAIVCHDVFRQSRATHQTGERLAAADFPAYFNAFSRHATVMANDAAAHPDTRDFAELYLSPHGITAMLDAPLRLGSDVAGLLCCEHTGGVRQWTSAEERFAISAAAAILQVWDSEHRRVAQAALKESEARLRNLAEAATEGIFFHENGIIFDANPELCRMVGCDLKELLGKDCLALAALELRAELGVKLASGKNLRYETIALRTDGSRFPIEISARSTVYQGRSVRVVCVRDLTQLHLAETQFRENEARLQRVMEGSQQGYWDWNVATGEVAFSDRWFTMLGYQPGELEQNYETWESLLHPEDKPLAVAAVQAHLEGRAARYEVELRMRTQSGGWRWILTRGHVVRRDASGRTLYLSGTHTDTTERKKMEARIRDRETLLSSINTHLPGSAVFRLLLAPDGGLRCSYVTPNVGPILGVEEGDFMAHPDLIFAHVLPDDLPLIRTARQRAFETGEEASFTFRTLLPDGLVHWLQYRGHEVERWPDGTQVRDGIVTDITVIKEAEAEVRRQAEFLDALHQTTLDLLDRREPGALMQAIVDRATTLLAAPVGEMLLKENEEMVVVGITRNQPLTKGHRLRREDAPLSWEAHDQSRPVVVANYSAHPNRRQIYDPLELQAVAEFPIVHQDICLGVISLGRIEPGRTFTVEEIRHGEILAKNAALVIHNADIYADAVREAEQRTTELRESEELYRSLVETSPAAIVVADLGGRILKVNHRAQEIFADDEDPPPSGRSIFEWVAPLEIPRLEADVALLQKAGRLHDVPAVLLRQGNQPFDALLDGVIIRDADGKPKTMMLLVQDISQRKQAEKALRESEERTRQIVETALDAVVTVDAAGRISGWNPQAEVIFGWAAKEALGKELAETIIPLAQRKAHRRGFQHFLESGEPRLLNRRLELTAVRSDGSEFPVELTVAEVAVQGQAQFSAFIRDITEHKQSEQALTTAHRHTSVLAQLGRELAEAGTPRMAALSILQAARQLIDWDCSWLHVWDERKQQFENLATFDLVEGAHCEVPPAPVAPGSPSPMLRRVMEHGPQLLLRKDETDQLNDLRLIYGTRRSLSLMFVPIRVAERFIGILSIQSYQRQAYDPAALNLLQTLADHCAGALARLQATSAQAASEERFRLVWENATDGMRLTDAEGRIVAANEAFCRMYGKTLKDVEGQLISALYAEPENRGILERHVERFARRDILTRLERQLTLADGRAVWLEVSNCFIETDPDRPMLLSILRDITERKLTEDALRCLSAGLANLTGESLFNEAVLQLTQLLGVEIGFIGKLLGGTPARVRMLGMCADGRLQPGLEFALAGTPCEAVIGKQAVILQGQAAAIFPANHPLSDLRVASYAAVPLFDRAGRALGSIGVMSRQPLRQPERVVGILQLFAVRVAAEIERQRAEQRFHDLFEFSPDAIVMADEEGRIVMANPQAEKLFGYSSGEMIGRSIAKLLPASERPQHLPQRPGYRSPVQPQNFAAPDSDLWGKKKDGTQFPVDLSLSALESDTGVWLAAAIRDLTELRRAQQHTLRAQRLESIGTLAGGVAHDLNNALAPIVVATEMLHQRYPQASELIDTMNSSALRAADIVKQLLTFARGVEGARLLIQPLHLLKDLEKIIRSTFSKSIQLETRYASDLRSVLGDTTQLQQVLLNLCVNARDAMPDGGTLTLTAENVELNAAAASAFHEARPGDYVVWRVTDTGVGVPPQIIERIFEPFFTTKGPTKGTGLGLSSATGIVKSHGGFIRAFSPPGQGATFEVYLPASDAAAVP